MARNSRTRGERIAAALRDDILLGRYQPGDRLPSERELAARHATSRGTVREALKQLEQLGLAEIRPGGARAAAIEACTLGVLGPLLELEAPPDPTLVDEVLEVAGLLMRFAAETAVRRNSPAELARVRALLAEVHGRSGAEHTGDSLARLFRLLAEASDHLVLRLLMNGLRGQAREHIRRTCNPRSLGQADLGRIARKLDTALEQRRPAEAGRAIEELFAVLRRKRAAPRQRVAS